MVFLLLSNDFKCFIKKNEKQDCYSKEREQKAGFQSCWGTIGVNVTEKFFISTFSAIVFFSILIAENP